MANEEKNMKFRFNRAMHSTSRKNNSAEYDQNDRERIDNISDENEEELSTLHGLRHWQGVAIILACYDIVAVNLAYFLSLWFRFDCHFSEIPGDYLRPWLGFAPAYTLICLVVFWRVKSEHTQNSAKIQLK